MTIQRYSFINRSVEHARRCPTPSPADIPGRDTQPVRQALPILPSLLTRQALSGRYLTSKQECAHMRHESILMASAAKPRGILAVRAMAEPNPQNIVAQLSTAFTDFRARNDTRLDTLEAAIDEQCKRDAFARLGGSGATPPDPEYTGLFASYIGNREAPAPEGLREANASGDRGAIQASMSVGDNSSGGYLAPVEWDRNIQKAQRALSPMRRIAQVVVTSQSAYSTLWSDDLFGSGWVGETASRPTTTANGFTPIVIPSGEIYAMPAVTQRLIDDSAIDVGAWLETNLADEFSRQEAIAFVGGDGTNKPAGFLTYVTGAANAATHPAGALGQTVSGHASLVNNPDALVDLKYGLAAPYRQNAVWLMNSSTAAVIAKLKDGQGNYIWRESLLASEPSTLLGRPVEIDEGMPNIGAGLYPIAFGDFQRGYLINDRIGVRILKDPYSSKPYVLFYATKRVGGAVLDPKAIRVLKVST